jgi:protein-disulfide isomerase
MERRRSGRMRGAVGGLSVALIVGVAVFALVSVAGGSGADASSTKAGGVPYAPGKAGQEGLTLGDPGAPVDLYEYCDLESPICRQFAEVVLPKVIREEVDAGKARITFRNFMIMGPGSPAAAAAAIAAGEQGDGWSFVEAFYRGRGKRDAGSPPTGSSKRRPPPRESKTSDGGTRHARVRPCRSRPWRAPRKPKSSV